MIMYNYIYSHTKLTNHNHFCLLPETLVHILSSPTEFYTVKNYLKFDIYIFSLSTNLEQNYNMIHDEYLPWVSLFVAHSNSSELTQCKRLEMCSFWCFRNSLKSVRSSSRSMRDFIFVFITPLSAIFFSNQCL